MTTAAASQPPAEHHKRIVWARKRKGISQEALAGMIGTSRRHMIRIEKGLHRPGQKFVGRIAEATGQPESFFSTEEPVDEEDESDVASDLHRALQRLVKQAVAQAVASA